MLISSPRPAGLTSARLALKLVDRGYPSVYVLEGGWKAWQEAGYPVEPK